MRSLTPTPRVASRLPLMDGLALTAQTVHNRVLRRATQDIVEAIRGGGSLSAAPVVRDLLQAAIAGNSGDDPDRASDPDALVDQGRNA